MKAMGLFGLWAVAVLLLVWLNPNHYTSPDSGYYLQSAQHLLEGRGYVIWEENRWVWNATFPPVYALLIAGAAAVTQLPVLWASKLVNVLAVGVSVGVWNRRFGSGQEGGFVWVWALGGLLRIAAYTWSETVFLVLLAEWVWLLYRCLYVPTRMAFGWLVAVGWALVGVRYVGSFVFLVPMGLCFNPIRDAVGVSRFTSTQKWRWIGVSVIGLLGVGVYLGLNFKFSGTWWGGERFVYPTHVGQVIEVWVWALLNEILLIRDATPGQPAGWVWVGLLLQIAWLYVGLRRLRHQTVRWTEMPTPSILSRLYVLAACLYVLVLFGLRIVSPFAGPDARLMAPFTFCLLWALSLYVRQCPMAWQRIVRQQFWVLVILSSLQLLPQTHWQQKLSAVRNALSRGIP